MAGSDTNPLYLAWKMLPPEVRKSYGSLADFVAEMSPGAAVRDAVNASGELTTSLLQGDWWKAGGAGAGLLTAMAGVVPGTKAATKVAKDAAKAAAKQIAEDATKVAAPAVKTAEKVVKEVPKPGETVTGLGGQEFKVVSEEQQKALLQDPKVKAEVKEAVAATKAGETGLFPWAAERYPELSAPVYTFDKNKGQYYLAKGTSPEAHVFSKVREQHLKDVNAGNFDPLFDPAKRYDVKGDYGKFLDTSDVRMKKPETIEKYEKIARNPEAMQKLVDAYKRGEVLPGSNDWYLVGQLEAPFIKEYGLVEGPKRFKAQFADAMAATTGGADPTANFLMGSYGTHLAGQGHTAVPPTWSTPVPIGGRYAANNLKEFQKVLMGEGQALDLNNPKRYDFSSAFLGNKNAMTMDEQMMTGLYNKQVPEPGTYGHYAAAARDVARQEGVDPRAYQDVPWHGFKIEKEPNLAPQPMVQNVNQSVERTARLTGLSPEEVYRQFMKKGPMYGIGALAVPGLLDFRQDQAAQY